MIMRRHGQAKRLGSASVELGFILPILVSLLLGIWEVGRLVEAQQILTNAAREGVRQASTGNVTVAQMTTIVNNYLTAAGLNNANSTVTIYNLTQDPNPANGQTSDDPTQANQLDHLHVIVTLPLSNVKWVIVGQSMTNVTTLTAYADFDSMVDQPLVVNPALPTG